MSDLATVRAEVKTWERDFRSRYDRDPSVQDIRDQPLIAEKYKLYKRLTKATASSSEPVARSSTNNPCTPPRTQPSSSLPPSADRPPLQGFNPFSPVKNKGKEKDTSRTTASQASRKPPSSNPFATPAKNKSNPHPHIQTPSPDPFPSILLPQPKASSSSSHDHRQSNTTVSRARKRLRGEPVSPSPNKPKRQRVGSPTLLSLPNLEVSSNSEGDSDAELAVCDFNSSFVDDSPVKAPAGGKSFKLLFDDSLSALSISKKSNESATSHSNGPTLDAYFVQGHISARTTQKHGQHDVNSMGMNSRSRRPRNDTQGKISNRIFATKDDLPSVPPTRSAKSSVPHKVIPTGVVSIPSQSRTSLKRAIDEGDPASENKQFDAILPAEHPLIPPSPPPEHSTYRGPSKGRAKAVTSRKKAKVEDEGSEEDEDSQYDVAFKVVTVTRSRGTKLLQTADDLDWDPLLNLGARNHDPAGENDTIHHESATFSVELPDKLRRVLAISPSRSHSSKEERVVRGLLYGDRVGNYDPSRGGDIWDVGEGDESVRSDIATEDDWEGEPVPWEVGEL
ncbi:hypothetical protein BU15DRAFT_85905 [Melanogaster broomeanus]|nr:hypothetical protein BU15DRAFT_85905 [Melanogaster broomeanus]